MNIYDFTVKDYKGNDVKLDTYKGKVLLIVNTATKCGHTKQYDALEKFYEEHTADLLLHKAAKSAFDELGVKKLPTIKALQTEYSELLSEKKKAYAKYHSIKKEMKNILTAKANVDHLLGENISEKEKEKYKKQR